MRLTIYIYIYIYVCVCVQKTDEANIFVKTSSLFRLKLTTPGRALHGRIEPRALEVPPCSQLSFFLGKMKIQTRQFNQRSAA